MFDTIKETNPYGEVDDILRIQNEGSDIIEYTFGNIIPLDDEYTFSLWIRSTGATETSVHISDQVQQFDLSSEWRRIVFTAQSNIEVSKEVYFSVAGNVTVYCYEGQLESGNKATDFKLNPADLMSKIDEVDNSLSVLQTDFKVEQGKITQLIKDTTIEGSTLKDKYLETVATVDGIQTTINSLETTVDGIESKTTEIETTVDGIRTEVSSVSTTAGEAKTLAEQTANKFSWIVESGTNETNFTLTERTAELVAENINLKGLVTFEGLSSDVKDTLEQAEATNEEWNDFQDNSGYAYTYDIILNGESGKYYPVVLLPKGNNYVSEYEIYRNYSEQAPSDWTDPASTTHMGALLVHFNVNAGGWGGITHGLWITHMQEQYSTMFGGVKISDTSQSIYTFLRGGAETGAIYHIRSNVPLVIDKTNSKHWVAKQFPYIAYEEDVIFKEVRSDGSTGAQDIAPAPLDNPDTELIGRHNYPNQFDNWIKESIVSGSTTINGGYIKTETIDVAQLKVDNIFSSGSAVMNIINAQEINANRITSGTIKADFLELYGLNVLQKDTNIVTLGIDSEGDITMRGTVESYNYNAGKTGWSIKNSGDAEFNDVTVRGSVITNDGGIVSSGGSGTNLIRNSNFFGGTTYWQKGSNTTYAVESDTTYGHVMKFSHAAAGDGNYCRIYFGVETFTHTAGVQYTLSFYVKADAACTVYAGWVGGCKPFKVGMQWIKVTSTYTPTGVGSLTFYCSLANTNVYIAMVKLEVGSIATPWSPAPEDTFKQVRFWAGSSYDQRESAPFIVYNDGSVKATKGDFSGVFSGTIEIGNITIADPSKTSGGDAIVTVQNGQNGVKRIQLRDTESSLFAQNISITDNQYNSKITLNQDGSGVFNNGVYVGSSNTSLTDNTLTLDGGVITSDADAIHLQSSAISIGTTGHRADLEIYGSTFADGDLTLNGNLNFDDVVVMTKRTNGLDIDVLK